MESQGYWGGWNGKKGHQPPARKDFQMPGSAFIISTCRKPPMRLFLTGAASA